MIGCDKLEHQACTTLRWNESRCHLLNLILCSVCLYLQNRAFEKHTAFMLNQLSVGAAKAAEELGNIGSTSARILATTQVVHEMAIDAGQSLQRIHRGQQEAAFATEKAFKEVTARFSRVHRQQQQSLDMQVGCQNEAWSRLPMIY